MTTVRIYQPSKTAMQSGHAKTHTWRVEFETHDPFTADPLMGWASSHDMTQELRLLFPTLEEALRFAQARGFEYTILNPTPISIVPKSYETNFTCPRMRGI